MQIAIREATFEDTEFISRLVSESAQRFIAPALRRGGLEILLETMSCLSTRNRIMDGWPHYCAFSGSQLVGVVAVKPPNHLYHLFVCDEFQDLGIGTKLFFVVDALPNGIKTVNSSLNAVEYYRQLDFVPEGDVIDTRGVLYQPMVRRIDNGNFRQE